ncbi:hypothetical protein SIID45300_00705 [Candidatus Magnetaquicoccaceae bacterium FCR-1]|uniref:Uncharacterized protein n=1 Tax=Candidatus Magnetaquiglobus chichijimensis TaxID=3141448 RepID=A0ABQ0C693_9PROT
MTGSGHWPLVGSWPLMGSWPLVGSGHWPLAGSGHWPLTGSGHWPLVGSWPLMGSTGQILGTFIFLQRPISQAMFAASFRQRRETMPQPRRRAAFFRKRREKTLFLKSALKSKVKSQSQKPKSKAKVKSQSQKPKSKAKVKSQSQKPKSKAKVKSQSQKPKSKAKVKSQSQKPKSKAKVKSQSQKPNLGDSVSEPLPGTFGPPSPAIAGILHGCQLFHNQFNNLLLPLRQSKVSATYPSAYPRNKVTARRTDSSNARAASGMACVREISASSAPDNRSSSANP